MPAVFNERPHQNEKTEALAYVRQLMEQARKESNHEDLPKLEKLLELLDAKRYGLVWEEHAELVEEEMKTKIPVFVEDETRKIQGKPESEDYNFLLEGDNLHSLHLLQKTHAEKIDVIYIDPPYNTGNKDFIYNDKIVDKTDGYSHSKWLSFMSKRLDLAKELLSETGVIFISIDDNEQAQLKLLCDEIFGEENFVATLVWSNKEGGGSSDSKLFKLKHEYIHVYSKNIDNLEIKGVPISNFDRYKLSDEFESTRGKYYLQKLGMGSIQYSSSLDYPIQAPDGNFVTPKENNSGNRACWRWSKDKLQWGIENGYVEMKQNKDKVWIVYTKQYLYADNNGNIIERTQRPMGIIDTYSSTQGAKQLKQLLTQSIFTYPKDTNLISWLINRVLGSNQQILDFFAGSGTTGHAVAQLNKEDGGNRKYILCTNNENKICEEVTYKRLSNIQEELPHNLKYFKTEFISKDDENLEFALLNNVKTLIELEHAVDLDESDKAVAFSLSEIRNLDLAGIKTVYVRQHSHALMDKEDRLRYQGIDLVDVPEYYFAKEMKEAGL